MAGYKDTVARAREFCSRYPTTGRNPFRFVLEAFCLPLEVFLRSGFGVMYFHIPKAFVGFLFPFLCMVLVNFGIKFHVSIYPWNMGFIRAYPTVDLPDSWGVLWDDIRRA